jgi:hypothetical protein
MTADRGKPMHSGKNLPKCHLINSKTDTDCRGTGTLDPAVRSRGETQSLGLLVSNGHSVGQLCAQPHLRRVDFQMYRSFGAPDAT